MIRMLYKIVSAFLLLPIHVYAMQFEGMIVGDINNTRVGLEYADGKYGEHHVRKGSKVVWTNLVTTLDEDTPYNYWFQAGPHNTYQHDNVTDLFPKPGS